MDKSKPAFVPFSLFTSSKFEKEFDEDSFVRDLTHKLLHEARKDDPSELDFHSSEFQLLFKIAGDEMRKIQDSIGRDVEDLELHTDEVEDEFQHQFSDFSSNMETVRSHLRQVDEQIYTVGHTALRIGQRLENVHRQIRRAQKASDLLEYFLLFEEGSDAFERAARTSGNLLSEEEQAGMLQTLASLLEGITKEDPQFLAARSNIRACSRHMVQNALKRFGKAVRSFRLEPSNESFIDEMARSAKLLASFDMETKACMAFVESVSIIQSARAQIQGQHKKPKVVLTMREEIPNLQNMFEAVEDTISTESRVIKRVFTNVKQALHILVERLFRVTIHWKVHQMLLSRIVFDEDEAEAETKRFESLQFDAEGADSFQRRLNMSIDLTDVGDRELDAELDDTLDSWTKSLDEEMFGKEKGSERTDIVGTGASASTSSVVDIGKLKRGPSLMSPSANAFKNEVEQEEIDRRVQYLTTLYQIEVKMSELGATIGKYGLVDLHIDTMCEELLGVYKKRYMRDEGRVVKLICGNRLRQAFERKSITTGKGWKRFILLGKDKKDVVTASEEAVQMAVELLYHNGEALKRCKSLSPANKLAMNVSTLFGILLNHFERYLIAVVDGGLMELESIDFSKQSEMPFFFVVQLCTHVVHKLERYFEQDVVPLIDQSAVVRLELAKEKNSMVYGIEEKVGRGLATCLERMSKHVGTLLSMYQRKSDFKPKEDDPSTMISTRPSTACAHVVKFISLLLKPVLSLLDGRNRESFVIQWATGVYETLSTHLKKYVVNSVGALQWMRDANEYATVFEQANIAIIDDMFQHLKDIASLFLIKPVSFKDCISTCSLSRMSHSDLQDFIRIRADYNKSLREFRVDLFMK
eukprot:TRINITY_DN5450_c0_g1_i3.p1 TRINITY_DN5450_c0_g1~~TRINITY_DN5450_c0_g1_i3.p1  ORF type:complete len:868 (+),score=252.80 TRINITY_DN5450_c0_g1_i3:143-2746(+)